MSFEDEILIESYLKGTLSKDALDVFNKRMLADENFKSKVAFEKKLFESLNADSWSFSEEYNVEPIKEYRTEFQSNETQELKKKIEIASSTYHNKQRKNKRWYFYASAAAIAILISVYGLLNQNIAPEKLYSSFIELDELPSFVSRQQEKDSLAIAQQFFENKDYDQALSIFSKELLNKKNNSTLYIYTGITQTELLRFDEAEQTFDGLISSDLIDAPKGRWYKALLFLKKGELDESKILLKEIIRDTSYNHKKAKKLLRKL